MSAERQVRASIGFVGGLVLAIRASPDSLGKLRDALAGDRHIYDLELEDGSVAVDLSQVAYLRVESDEPRVGFGT
jgi:hypothetical protein